MGTLETRHRHCHIQFISVYISLSIYIIYAPHPMSKEMSPRACPTKQVPNFKLGYLDSSTKCNGKRRIQPDQTKPHQASKISSLLSARLLKTSPKMHNPSQHSCQVKSTIPHFLISQSVLLLRHVFLVDVAQRKLRSSGRSRRGRCWEIIRRAFFSFSWEVHRTRAAHARTGGSCFGPRNWLAGCLI